MNIAYTSLVPSKYGATKAKFGFAKTGPRGFSRGWSEGATALSMSSQECTSQLF